MKLLLTSQGLPSEITKSFLSFLTKSPEKYTVGFITTAAFGIKDANTSWLEFYREELRSFGIDAIEDIDLRDFTKQSLQVKLQKKDIIYVNGGNTFYLMKYVQESGFGQLLPELLQQNKLYIGVSAGSVIMGPDIALASWIPNDEDINADYVTDTKGLNFVPFAIWPHFKHADEKILEEKVKTIDFPIVALTNTQALLWQDDAYTLVGSGEEKIYTKK